MNENKVVVFKIDGEEYAADIMQVERILGYIEPTKVPESPAFIKGVIKYQEGILPVMDLKKRFNLKETSLKEDPKIIVVKHNDKCIGLIVDMVSEVVDIKDENIENAPEIIRGISNKYVKGLIKLSERIIIFIDTEKILSKEDFETIISLT
jgi:purine-binding chemotaxis protein CheW